MTKFVEVDEQGYFLCDAPHATGDEPNVAPHTASDNTSPDGMRKARYVNNSWIDEEAAQLTATLAKQAAIQAVSDAKAAGFDYNGTMVSVTGEDANGALQIAYGFEQMGMQSTRFMLSNGNEVSLTLAEWPAFKAAFFAARSAFFS